MWAAGVIATFVVLKMRVFHFINATVPMISLFSLTKKNRPQGSIICFRLSTQNLFIDVALQKYFSSHARFGYESPSAWYLEL
jgi:hypothetical protein